jgi:hypothetical protein
MSDAIADRITRMTEFIRRSDKANPSSEAIDPKDAATLILIDRSGAEPKVLLGKRHDRHVFMPGKFVFPGGGVDPSDEHMLVASRPTSTQIRPCSVFLRAARCVHARWRSLRSATCEETGLARHARGGKHSGWPVEAFGSTACRTSPPPSTSSAAPSAARTVAPFRRALFTMDASAVAHRIEGHRPRRRTSRAGVGCRSRMLKARHAGGQRHARRARVCIAEGLGHELPVPFYYTLSGNVQREEL